MAEATKKSGGRETSGSQRTDSGTVAKKSAPSKARAPRSAPARKMTGARVAERAVSQLTELAGKEVEGVTALRRTDDGWEVELECLELRRIPSTTDVLATYQVTLDSSGELEEYQRLGRYVRGQVEEGS